ncbi:MAG: quinoprotein dehydrogenase-associated SoxYZ-like carrier [Methylibium sp.]|uniref:quinoprotein dehydrogenase-associated SoxYZ-like carrier n=1 Tax=Methylibium sp. TaxID=2067992 RepID=UPI00185C7702|nr:quinoprotein dehydrogenase-associated SoxYZ-like carrier [Methylibium sp.]MBA3596073.1 quinoprotein dehydrogenase-associated SoxYZ-like carrier [Methylibium sp.]
MPAASFSVRAVSLLVCACAAMSLAPAAVAAPGGLPTNVQHTDSSPQWEKLRTALFKDRKVEAGTGKVELTVPLRAAYGASVPVKITSKLPQAADLYVKRVYLLVDKNPSPVAAVLDLTTEIGQADFETRLRVDEYSHIRVVSELSNGELHMHSRYVKVSGGCSAPPNRDQLHNIGKTVFKLPSGVKLNEPTAVDVQVTHPNDTGFELNNVTVMFIPPHFVRSLKVSYAGRKLFDAELDFSIAENPAWRFNFVPRGEGELTAEVEDSKEGRFTGSLAVRAPADVAQAGAAAQ